MPDAEFPSAEVQEARLRAHRDQRAEGLSRRGDRLAHPIRRRPQARLLRERRRRHIACDARRRGSAEWKSTISTSRPAATSRTRRSTRSSPTSSDFVDEMERLLRDDEGASSRAILVGDLDVAPLEHDVWSHKALLNVVSHTPIEVEKFTPRAGCRGSGLTRCANSCLTSEKLYTWWSYRSPDWKAADKGAGSIMPGSVRRSPTPCRRCGVLRDSRRWERPSDHVR